MVQAVLSDWRTAPIGARLRAMLGFIEKLTLHPDSVRPADIVPLRAQGLSDDAIEDGIQASVLFNIYDRMADSLGWHLPDRAGYAASGRSLMERGYKI
ncbi:MAG: hypothetical protein ABR537_12070 [Gemmatimonadales bacterium]